MSDFTDAANTGNNMTTTVGAMDMAKQARAADQIFDMTNGVSRAEILSKADDFALPGSGLLNFAGGALSMLGLGLDIDDMISNGVSAENVVSASGNGAGVVSALAGATPLGAATAGWSLGTTTGQAGINHARKHGYLGRTNTEYESAGNRGYDDLAADAGRWVQRKLGDGVIGDVAGGITTVGTSILATPAAAVSGIASGVESAGRFIFNQDEPLLEGIRAPRIPGEND